MKASILNRKLHRWGAILAALPVLIVVCTGILLQLKKEWEWIQPGTVAGEGTELELSFDRILAICATAKEAGIESWAQVDRLDVRPGKGMVKVRGKNRWEIQVDLQTGTVLQVAYRRSDLIEEIHDGSFFHDVVKLWVFLPSAVVLFGLWVTGVYLWFLPHLARRKRREKRHAPV